MALFSFRHSVKTFSKKVVRQSRIAKLGQTLAHIRYITRDSAARVIMSERLPESDFGETAATVERAAERSGGRVCERFTLALPLEANEEQRKALVVAFAEHITKGEAGYIAAIHDKKENDLLNPHSHLICFDTFTRKGGRGRPSSVMGMASKNAIEKAAEDWANIHNKLMNEWGFGVESFIDHRSYAERGIDLVPTIHEGPGARKIAARQPNIENKPEWQHIDDGHTRAEANKLIKQINSAKENLNEQRTNRLRGDDDANADRVQGSVPWLGTSGRSNRGNGRTATGQRNGIAKEPRNNEPNFGRLASCQNRSGPPFKVEQAQSRPTPSSTPSMVHSPKTNSSRVRRPRLRRTFRALVMYRDTLQSRLLRSGAPRQFLKNAEALTHETPQQSVSQKTNTPEDFSR